MHKKTRTNYFFMIKNFIVLIQLSYFLGIKQIFATEFIYKYKSIFFKTPGTVTPIQDLEIGADKRQIKIRACFTKALVEETNSKTKVDFEKCNIYFAIKEEFEKVLCQDLSHLIMKNVKIKESVISKEAKNFTNPEQFILDFEFDIFDATNAKEFFASLNDMHFFFINIRYNNKLNQLMLNCSAENDYTPEPLFSAPRKKQEEILCRDDSVPFELTKWDDNVPIEKNKNALQTETIEYIKDKQPESEYEEPILEESTQHENLQSGEEMPEIIRSPPDSIGGVEKEYKISEEEIGVDKTVNNKKEKSYWKSPPGKMLAVHASISWIGFIIPMICFTSTML